MLRAQGGTKAPYGFLARSQDMSCTLQQKEDWLNLKEDLSGIGNIVGKQNSSLFTEPALQKKPIDKLSMEGHVWRRHSE
jgi:hypothetical protein